MSRAMLFLLCCGFGLSGCGLLQATRDMAEHARDVYTATPNGRRDDVNDEDAPADKDTEEMMLGARAASGVQGSAEPDKWWYDYVMSPEARSIERDLGVSYY